MNLNETSIQDALTLPNHFQRPCNSIAILQSMDKGATTRFLVWTEFF
jgi:hypothetical protein